MKKSELDNLITKTLREMQAVRLNSEEYNTLLSQLERLYALKGIPQPMNKETLAIIAGNLFGILLIVAYEQKHVVTSKAFGSIIKPKTGN